MTDPDPIEPTTDGPDGADVTPGSRVERPHPLTPLVRSWILILAFALTFGREFLNEVIQGNPFDGDPFDGPFEFTLYGTPVGPAWMGLAVIGLLASIIGFGYLSWRATRFVIDEAVLRLESGVLFRQSKRIAFDKVQSIDVMQPLAARLLGLAELQLDLGGGSQERLRYLSRSRAYALRDYLLSRARGARAEIRQDLPSTSQTVLADLDSSDEILIQVQPHTLILAALTSHEFFLILISGVGVAAVGWFSGFRWSLLLIAIPIVSSLFGFLSRRVSGQFNYTLSRREHGIRISRGLTSLTSQSLPPRRVQAVRISQSLLWRRLGLYRMDIDVLGLGALTTDESSAGTSSILLPAGTIDEVRIALAALWPQADYERIPLQATPARARWLHPLSQPFLRWGHDDLLVVSQRGWLVRHWQLVPHARIQSVRIVSGPASRRLRLANLEFHTAGMRINPSAAGVDVAQVRAEQVELMRLVHHQPAVDISDPLPTPPAGPPDQFSWPPPEQPPDSSPLRARPDGEPGVQDGKLNATD